MKNLLLIATCLMALGTLSCSKQQNTPQVAPVTAKSAAYTEHTITKETADSLIGSYRLSVVSQPEALQALDITASVTMLSNPQVTAVRAYYAHTPAWASLHYGEPAGYDATRMTIVIVGFDVDGYAVAFDEHFSPCPGPQCTYVNVKTNSNGTFAVR